jgi:DNA-binding XRE family transcriptional regulator
MLPSSAHTSIRVACTICSPHGYGTPRAEHAPWCTSLDTSHLERIFGQVVREVRLKVGISQEELADRAGLHRTYVSLLERGKRNPSLNVIQALAAALGTTMTFLVSEVEARQGQS